MFASVEVAASPGDAGSDRPRQRPHRLRCPPSRARRARRRSVRTARRHGRPACGGMVEIVAGLKGRRNGRHVGDIPDRRRKQSARGAARLCGGQGSNPMIAAVIRWSARNLLLVLVGDGARHLRRHLCARHDAGRRDPRSLGHASHRLHGVSGPSAASGRGSGHLSADHRDVERAASRAPCAASRISASASSTSFSRTAPTSIGRAAACSSI